MQVTECNSGINGIYCICGIAIRAGADVFVIDRCPTQTNHKPPVFGYKTCKDDILDVRKIDEFHYEVSA